MVGGLWSGAAARIREVRRENVRWEAELGGESS